MASFSYPKPQTLHEWQSISPRPLQALTKPPEVSTLPRLPSPLRDPEFTSTHTLTTHLIPAAFPRAPTLIPSLPEPAANESRAERMRRVEQTTETIIEAKRKLEWGNGEDLSSGTDLLWTALNRYARKSKPTGGRGVTLLMAHANGLHKETWETAIKHLLSQTEVPGSSVSVEEIWTFDAVQHGDSGLVNSGKLAGIFDWQDNARDILNILINYLPETFQPEALPTHIDRIANDIAERRKRKGFQNRRVIAIGHSIGGCSTALAAHAIPSVFDSIMFVDPVILPARLDRTKALATLVRGAVARRTEWSSREEAKVLLFQSPFFSVWHPSVLQSYIEHAMTDHPSGSVQLKTPGLQEAVVFTESRAPIEAWEVIPLIEERIPLRWVMSGKDNTLTGGDSGTCETVWRRPQNSSNVRIRGAGHLVTQEAPIELAEEVHRFLDSNFSDDLRSHL